VGQRSHHHGNKRQKARSAAPPPPALRVQPTSERKPTIVYGKPFIVLEDDRKETFVYSGGRWVQHSKSIAECRQDSQVKELPQKINGMTRYEICSPLSQ
jgi:hypothetical protein